MTTPPRPARAAPGHRDAAPKSIPTLLLGTVGGSMILLALVLLVVGGGPEEGALPAEPPPVALIQPTAGAVIDGPVALEFRVPVRLRPGAAGWGADGLHLHADVDGVERMAAAGELEALGGDRYRWPLPGFDSGRHTVRLFWSGPDHQPVAGGGSPAVTFTVRSAGPAPSHAEMPEHAH